MDSSSALSLFPLILISLFLFPCLSFSFRPYVTKTSGRGFTARLIHHDSIGSPFYNPNLTKSDRIQAAIRRSHSRQHYLQSTINSKGTSPKEVQGTVKPFISEYVISYYIGTPPTETFGILDTASDLIWIQCLPCEECYPQKSPIFDPNKSSSYEKIKCDDPQCDSLPAVRCNKNDDTCHYGAVYDDSASTQGDLSLETLIFGDHRPDNSPGNITLNNMIFGCGHKNSEVVDGDDNAPGIVGLNRKSLSLLSQLSMEQFSFCLTPTEDEESVSFLHIGLSGIVEGPRTPILDVGHPDYYYLNLTGISVDDESLPIPADSFIVKPNGDGGFIIDSGTTFTYLEEKAFNMLVDAVAEKMVIRREQDPHDKLDLCYRGVPADIVQAPIITFHFPGVDIIFGTFRAWLDMGEGLFCLAMLPTSGMSIFGNHQLQNVNVGFDVEKKTVTFNAMDCTKAN